MSCDFAFSEADSDTAIEPQYEMIESAQQSLNETKESIMDVNANVCYSSSLAVTGVQRAGPLYEEVLPVTNDITTGKNSSYGYPQERV